MHGSYKYELYKDSVSYMNVLLLNKYTGVDWVNKFMILTANFVNERYFLKKTVNQILFMYTEMFDWGYNNNSQGILS